MKKTDISKKTMLLAMLLLCMAKLFITYTQYATIYPPLAPIDDDLMFKAAQSITKGEWLGAYNYLTMSKHMFFSLWLSFLHIIKVPYLVGNAALLCLASFFCTKAIAPVIKKNYLKLFLFAGLLYNPASTAQFTTRIYRDSIFPTLCLFFFGAVIGIGLRYKDKISSWWGYLALQGLSFGAIYLCREDGVWLLPFGIVAGVIIIFLLFKEKDKGKIGKSIALFLPFVLSFAVICGYCYMNFLSYGRFIVSDFTSKEFKNAYGAITSIEHENWNPMVAVPKDVREKLYQAVPSFAPVEQALQNPLIEGGYKWGPDGDFHSGGFYWALRNALQNLGVYDTPQSAQKYYENLYSEIKARVEDKTLSADKLRSGITSPIRAEYVLPVIKETFVGFKTVVLFEQCGPLASKAVGYPEEIKEVEDFIHQKGGTVLKANTDIVYLSPLRKITHGFMDIMIIVYKIFIPIFLVIALLWQIKQLKADLQDKKFTQDSMLNVIMLGVLGMAVLRCAMIAFVEVSAFGIGTYAMYLATVHPLIIIYGFVGFCKTFEI